MIYSCQLKSGLWLGVCHMHEWLRCTSSITTTCSSLSTVEVLQLCHRSFGRDHSFCTGKETVWQFKQPVCKILVLSSLCQHTLNVRLLPACSSCIQDDPSFQHSLILTRYFDLHQMVSTLSVNILYSWSYLATLETDNPKTVHHFLEEWTLHSDWLSHHQSIMIFSIIPSIFYTKRNLFLC
jgi:hypothetical protein